MNPIFETDRLRLKEFTHSDTEFIIALLNSEGWIKFIGDRNVKSTEDAKRYIDNGPVKSYRENGYGLSLVERKSDNVPIGMCGIINRPDLEIPDIGFAFLPEFEGMGYAFEIANATLKYANEKLNLPKISAITVAYNERSIRLIEKLGLKFIKKFYMQDDDEELLLYNN